MWPERTRYSWWLVIAAALGLSGGTAGADDPYPAALAPAVTKLVAYQADNGGKGQVRVAPVEGPPGRSAGGAERIARAVIDQLKKNMLTIDPKAEWVIVPRYEVGEVVTAADPARPVLGVLVDLEVIGPNKKSLRTTKVSIPGAAEVIRVAGPSADLTGAKTGGEVEERLLAAAVPVKGSKPTVRIDGTAVFAVQTDPTAKPSPYEVEILVDKKPVRPALTDGEAVFALPTNRPFTVRLTNRSSHEAAVELTLDGFGAFDFSKVTGKDKKPQYTHYLIPPGETLTVGGWHVTDEQVDEFLVTERANAVRKDLPGEPPAVRAITAVFAAAWEKGQPAPEGEPAVGRGGPNNLEVGIGRGQPKAEKAQPVARQVGLPRATVSVRYKAAEK